MCTFAKVSGGIVRSLWVPRREGAMSPGERALVYGILALIGFSLLPPSPYRPIGAPTGHPPVLLMAALFAMLGLAGELRWYWRVLLGTVLGSGNVLVQISHGALPPTAIAGMLYLISIPVSLLLVASLADPPSWMRRWYLSASLSLPRIARAAAYYTLAAVFLIALFVAAVSAALAARLVYELIQILAGTGPVKSPFQAPPEYARYMAEAARRGAISALGTSAVLFTFVFAASWVKALRKALFKGA